MKAIRFSLSLLLFSAVLFSGCRKGKDGEPGPAGQENLNKQGSISGTLHYSYYNTTTSDHDTLIIPFDFQYYESEMENIYITYPDPQDQEEIHRYIGLYRRELNDAASGMQFDCTYGTANNVPAPFYFNTDFHLSRALPGNSHYAFSFNSSFDGINDASDITVTNYSFNSATGALRFDYEIEVDTDVIDLGENEYSTVRPKIIGTVDVIMKKSLVGYIPNF